MSSKIRVWDLPTRLFHWGLVLCAVGLFTTAWLGSSDMVWHFRFGYATLSLLLFRVIWGLVGGHWSRFSSFVYAPSALQAYWRGDDRAHQRLGHTPMAALSVFAMLGFLLLQVATGLFSDDEVSAQGPLTAWVPNAWVQTLTFYHADIGQYLVLALLGLHVAAVIYYLRVKQQNLIRPMLSGDKDVSQPAATASRDDARTRLLAVVVYLFCLGLVLGLLKWTA